MKAMVDGHEDVVKQMKPMAGNQTAMNTGSGLSSSGATGSPTAGGLATASGSTASGSTGSATASGAVGTSGAGASSVAAYAAKTLPTVQHHLEQAKQLEKTAGKDK